MAILRAMGADKAQIKAIIKNQVNFLTIAGSVLGLVSAFLFYNFGLEFLRTSMGNENKRKTSFLRYNIDSNRDNSNGDYKKIGFI